MKAYDVYESRIGRKSSSNGHVEFSTWKDALGYVRDMFKEVAKEYSDEYLHFSHDVYERGACVVTAIVLMYDDLKAEKARVVYEAWIEEYEVY